MKGKLNISELWIAHSELSFPVGYGGKEIAGVCVSSIDTYASGCISSYVKSKSKRISVDHFQILQNCKRELYQVLSENLDSYASNYFQQLYNMCETIPIEAKIG